MLSLILSLASVLLLHPGQNSSRWVVQEQRFGIEIYSEFEPDLQTIWDNLHDVQDDLEGLVQLRPSADSVQIMLFSSHASYLRYLTPSIPEARHRKAIFYRNGTVSQIYAYRSRSLITDLRHELTHVILHQNLQFLPLWIDEGLAEYLEEPAAVRLRSGRMTSVRWKVRFGWDPSLRELESIPSAAQMTEDHYRDSWAWVCFLLNDSAESRQALTDYLQTIAKGEAPGPFSLFPAAVSAGSKNRLDSYFRRIQIPISFAKE